MAVLTLNFSGDDYLGPPIASIAVDGGAALQVTVSAVHGSTSQAVPIVLAAGSHQVVVSFANDAYGGSPALDRNLYLDGATLDIDHMFRAAPVTMLSGATSATILVTVPAADARAALEAAVAADSAALSALAAKTAADVAALTAQTPPSAPPPPVAPVVIAPPVVAPVPTPVPAAPTGPVTKQPVLLTVGPNQQFKSITEAMESIEDRLYNKVSMSVTMQLEKAADDYYANDVSTHFHHPSGWPVFEQTIACDMRIERIKGTLGLIPIPITNMGALYYGKASLILGQSTVSLSGLTFSGDSWGNVDSNLAGVRIDDSGTSADVFGDFTFEDCEFGHCDDGVLGGSAGQTVRFIRCYFPDDGSGSGLTHALYIGHVSLLHMEDCLSVGARVGHLLKSRAKKFVGRNLRLLDRIDAPASECASYQFDAPNGGDYDIDGLITYKAANGNNNNSLAIGEEDANGGGRNPLGTLKIRHWTAATDKPGACPFWNALGMTTDIDGTKLHGFGAAPYTTLDLFHNGVSNPTGLFPDKNMTILTARPVFDYTSPCVLQA